MTKNSIKLNDTCIVPEISLYYMPVPYGFLHVHFEVFPDYSLPKSPVTEVISLI